MINVDRMQGSRVKRCQVRLLWTLLHKSSKVPTMFNSPGFLSITLIDHTWCMGAHCMYVKNFAVDPNRIREEIPEIVCGQRPLLFSFHKREEYVWWWEAGCLIPKLRRCCVHEYGVYIRNCSKNVLRPGRVFARESCALEDVCIFVVTTCMTPKHHFALLFSTLPLPLR